MGDIKQLLIPIVVTIIMATTAVGRDKENSDPAQRQKPVGQDLRMLDRTTNIVGKKMDYKTTKKSIYEGICQMIKQAQDIGWPFRPGDFAERSSTEESTEIQKIINETYWEICLRKSSIDG